MLTWNDGKEYKPDQEYPEKENQNYLNDIIGVKFNGQFSCQIITRNMQISNFNDKYVDENNWVNYLIDEGTYIYKVDLINQKNDSMLLGLKFYGSDGSVLLSVGCIDDPSFKKSPLFVKT